MQPEPLMKSITAGGITVQQYIVHLPKWQIDLTVLETPEGPFYVIREMCGILGIKDHQQQIETLNGRTVTKNYMRQWPARMGQRVQRPWCIHQDAVAYWWGYINESRVRPEVAPRLIKLQQDILIAAKQTLYGMVESESTGVVPLVHTIPNAVLIALLALADRVARIEAVIDVPEDDLDPQG